MIMRRLDNRLSKRKIDYKKLEKYGFEKEDGKYIYKTKIQDNQFEINVVISEGTSYSKLIDLENEEDFVLVDVETSNGKFVGHLRQEYEDTIEDIIEKCTSREVFKCKQTKEVISYIEEKYGDKLEFLWEKFDDNAIWRNKQNNKWYALLIIIPESKLGLKSDKIVEAIDLRYQKEKIENIIDNKKIFLGYHMNKKSWITIKLDESFKTSEIFDLIDNSYNLSIGNKCGFTGDCLARKVYEYLMTIPKGKVVTYKQVAESLGNKGLARAVGNILHKNPDEKKYPCYKVLNSKGELAEAFAFGGKKVQKERLEKEGIIVVDNKVDLKVYQWQEK